MNDVTKDSMDRDNETWIAQLGSTGPEQRRALSDLRAKLLKSLRGAFSGGARIDEALLEDAIQDSLVRILERLSQFEGRSQFLTWATSIAIRVAMSELRKRRWKDISLEEVAGDRRLSSDHPIEYRSEVDEEFSRKAMINAMHQLIHHQLTEKQRTALLAELRGMPQDEIARHLGSTRNAVYKLTHDARKRLKQGLKTLGYDADDIRSAFTP